MLQPEGAPQVGTDGRTGEHDRCFRPYRTPETDGDGTGYQRRPGVVALDTALPARNGIQNLRHPMADVVPHDVADKQPCNENTDDRIHQVHTKYKTEPIISFLEELIIAFASACTERHSSYCVPLGTLFSSLTHFPKSVQFALPRGAPLYPVDIISSFFTITAPKFLRIQVALSVIVSAMSK